MSYSWVGAPAEFNGTNAELGGDSRMYITSVIDRELGIRKEPVEDHVLASFLREIISLASAR
jgi:hypothetical protein